MSSASGLIFNRWLRICGMLALFALATSATLFFGILGGGDASSARASDPEPGAVAPLIRVLLANRVDEARIEASLPPTLSGEALGEVIRLALPEESVSVSLSGAGWHIGNRTFPRGTLIFTPLEDGSVRLNSKRYRGKLRFVPRNENEREFDVINDLDIESYLMGVLPSELPIWFHMTTYEAQAVVARTYALWELKTAGPGRLSFDVYDDDRSQVYGGMDVESSTGRRAVAATRGQVVVHETDIGLRIFKAYFHSTSGGVTLGVESAFNEPAIKALSAQSLDDLSKASRFFRWDPMLISKEEMTTRMKGWGERRGHPIKNIGTVNRLEIASSNEFGRPTRFEVIDARGNRYSLIPEEIRWALNTGLKQGDARIHSGFFTPINNDTNIVISDGRGWGHGVGMCQFTADAWARSGKDHVEIVTLSYPGAQVVRAY